ncbi:Rv3654c family TadE-like protein [Jiangella rhizosphaerae]|uniref:Pilus assembly protein TadE n=1 Tax=Jiangella rhizosphaerae TaxID=2293569 RepID=A0A418KSW8_9ACTN|nr:Rv3654c family TadE-like protein [Jiangella rhizosphaerae]RIQ27331.1 pilus assembly protein TadE [Jiangella rhizosphaerae]
MPVGRRGAELGRECGAGTVLILSVVLVIMVATQAVAVLAAGQSARHRAAAAADLAALAAANRLALGSADPCADAGRIAEANGAALRDCVVDGMEVEVQVRVETTSLLPWLPAQDRRARAGPPRPS